VYTGWILLVLMVILAMYNLRKRLPFLPLGTSAAWLQFHVYIGFLTLVLFFLHINLRVPKGILEGTLSLLYVTVAGTGILGLILSRLFAKRLASRGEEVIFERIPGIRRHIRENAETLIERSVSETNSSTLQEFYAEQLDSYFRQMCNFWGHIFNSVRPRHTLLTNLGEIDRYLNDQEREIAADLANLICVKDDLDYHHTLQGILKYWLFIHIPLSFSLLIVPLMHAILATTMTVGLS
jgi:hypothetical protein